LSARRMQQQHIASRFSITALHHTYIHSPTSSWAILCSYRAEHMLHTHVVYTPVPQNAPEMLLSERTKID